MKYYIIAGEASGDMHGSNLISAIQKKDMYADFRCWGGKKIKKKIGTLVRHYSKLDFMGFAEVVLNFKTILLNLSFCKKDILDYKPDALILIDYPGFNLRIAKFAKQQGVKVCFYISPQVWAWNQKRVNIIRKYVDQLLLILPFEKDFYQLRGMNPPFVGHPLLDEIARFKPLSKNAFYNMYNIPLEKDVVALLPGSRTQELNKMLPIMIGLKKKYSTYTFLVAGTSVTSKKIKKRYPNIIVVENNTYNLLNVSKFAIVTSGTAALETALFNVPQIICYKANWISYLIAKILIKLKYISLVNLILDKEVVKELVQTQLTVKNLIKEFKKLENPLVSDAIKKDYLNIKKVLGGVGASRRAAQYIIDLIKK